ncbi:hypothetical protein DFH27DRAFT_138774 [Peziza echinospora]|nr:hypothetical protein DFH27DRAFT_138774 [Peziza echinospora]
MHATAEYNGKVIAEADHYEVVEGNVYFPPESLKKEYFKPTSTQTTCSWKGVAHYYTVEVNGMKDIDAAWYYPETKPAAEKIKGYVAFYKNKVNIKTT